MSFVADECRVCDELALDPVSPNPDDHYGTGRKMLQFGAATLIIGYCPACLSQVAWMLLDGESHFAKISWKKIER